MKELANPLPNSEEGKTSLRISEADKKMCMDATVRTKEQTLKRQTNQPDSLAHVAGGGRNKLLQTNLFE
jgi:hypothetical protein